MSKKSIESRLTVVERQLVLAKGVMNEIYIQYGANIPVRAKIVGQSFEGEPGEDFDSLQTRVRSSAEAEGAKVIVYGGFPENPREWAGPPGMADALVKANWYNTDELDSDDY